MINLKRHKRPTEHQIQKTRKENPHDIIVVKILNTQNKKRVIKKKKRQKGQSLEKAGP